MPVVWVGLAAPTPVEGRIQLPRARVIASWARLQLLEPATPEARGVAAEAGADTGGAEAGVRITAKAQSAAAAAAAPDL